MQERIPLDADRPRRLAVSGARSGIAAKPQRDFGTAAFLLGIVAAGLAQAQEDSVIELDPVGQPGMHASSKAPGCYIWWEDDVWHVRHRTVAKGHSVRGKIEVAGGKVTKVFNFQSMEVKRKKADGGMVNPARDTISFHFRTKGREDGFEFAVSKNAAELVFSIQIDDQEMPQRIHVGKSGINPPKATFRLPARPDVNK